MRQLENDEIISASQ